MSDVHTLRWGDQQAMPVALNAAAIVPVTSKQLVSAHWERPFVWLVQIFLAPGFAAGEAGTFTLTVNTVIGSGQGTTNMTTPYNFTAPFLPLRDQGIIPGQDLQINCTLTGTATSVQPNTTFLVAAYIAPFTADTPARGAEHGHHEIMPPGFYEERLRYR